MSDSPSDNEYSQKVERGLRRGNINFDFLNPARLPDVDNGDQDDRRLGRRMGKRGLFNRGRVQMPMAAWHSWLWLLAALICSGGLTIVWNTDNLLALLAVPFLLSGALASLIMLGLFLARPR
jgi:hypothetical protein